MTFVIPFSSVAATLMWVFLPRCTDVEKLFCGTQ
jgi:hypothetical protein